MKLFTLPFIERGKDMEKKRGILIGATSLLLVTLILLGLTYAYYKTKIIGNTNEKSVSVVSKKMEATYTDGSATLSMAGKIEPGFTAEKEFTVTNTGNESVKYSIILDNIENTFTRDQDWEYTLTKSGTQIATGTIAVGTHQVLIGSETLESGSQTYKLEVTYVNSDEDQSEDMGQKMSFRVNISDEAVTWDNATSGTLLYAIKTNQPSGTGSTTPGREASTSTEARILSTQDDYGTSYVYRGNVTNNYVNYSGMCWRIVRVQGDGTIKLTLADEKGECNADTYSTTNYWSAFVDGRTNIEYKSHASYDATDFPFENSDIPAILSDWATNKTLDTSKLVDAEWCNDTAKISESVEDYTSLGPPIFTRLHYGTYDRLYPISTANPTLKCNTKGMEGTTGTEANAQRYKNTLGILSADEIAFAGSTSYQSGTTYDYYLQTNASGNFYWTMSPYYWDDGYNYFSIVWRVLSDGSLDGYLVCSYEGSVRPAVVLASSVTVTSSGDGTQTNPYVIS